MLQKLVLFLVFTIFLAVYPPLTDYLEFPKVVIFVVILPISSILYALSIASKQKSASGISQFFSKAPIIFGLLGLFLFAALLSSILAGTWESFWGQPYRYQGIIFFTFLSIFSFLISQYQVYGLSLEAVRKTIVISVGLSIGLILLQGVAYMAGVSVYTFDGRMTGLIGNPNFAGGVIALSYPYFFYHWESKKMALAVATVGAVLAILLTDSRGAMIAFGLALVLLFARKMNKKFLLVSTIPVVILAAYFFPQRASSHFDSRTIIWQKGWQAFSEKPVFGWGIENFSRAFQAQLVPEGDFDLKKIRVDKAHNEFLEMLVATGLVGAAFYGAVIGYTLWVLWKNRAEDYVYLQLVSVVVFLTLAQVNVLSITEYIFLFIAIGVAASLDRKSWG